MSPRVSVGLGEAGGGTVLKVSRWDHRVGIGRFVCRRGGVLIVGCAALEPMAAVDAVGAPLARIVV